MEAVRNKKRCEHDSATKNDKRNEGREPRAMTDGTHELVGTQSKADDEKINPRSHERMRQHRKKTRLVPPPIGCDVCQISRDTGNRRSEEANHDEQCL